MKCLVVLAVLLAGCGSGVGLVGNCQQEQKNIQAAWGNSPPDRIDGGTWVYEDPGVGVFKYRFELQNDGTCKVLKAGAGSDSDFNPEMP